MARRELQEVNAGSMADIAFLLLIFFLVTTTMDVDSGIPRMLPPPVPPDQVQEDNDVKERNVFVVLINKNNDLLVEGKPMKVSDLKEATKEFFVNPANKETLPEKKTIEVDFFGQYEVSKGVVSLQNDRGTKYETYIMVQNELVRAVNELRDELSKRKFTKNYEDLNEDQQKAVRTIYPLAISEAEPRNVGTN